MNTPRPVPEIGLNGHNRISTQALVSTANAAAAETFGLDPGRVKSVFTDDGGLLALQLALALPIPPLTQVVEDPQAVDAFGGSVARRAAAAGPVVLQRVAELTGTTLSRVDIRVTGLQTAEKRSLR